MWHLLFTVALIVASIVIYVLWIRPNIRNLPHIKELYDSADSFWQRLWARMRAAWDLIVALAMIGIPEVLDLLSQFQALDLSAFVPGEWAKLINQSIGFLIIVLRAINLIKTKAA